MRLVAFCVRTVLCRVSRAVAVDLESFVAAAPPGCPRGTPRPSIASGPEGAGREERPTEDQGKGAAFASRVGRREEIKEDVVLDAGGEPLTDAAAVLPSGSRGAGAGWSERGGGGGGDWGREAEREGEEGGGEEPKREPVVVLVPTHRSYLDFVLVSLLCATMRCSPGLSWLRVPMVAAASDAFGPEGSPLRWLLARLGERSGSIPVAHGGGGCTNGCSVPDPWQHRLRGVLGVPGGGSRVLWRAAVVIAAACGGVACGVVGRDGLSSCAERRRGLVP